MRRIKHHTIIFFTTLLLAFFVGKSEAFILINEILADPPAGSAGDANLDGTPSSSQDEFIEIFNDHYLTIDISGWVLTDHVRIRHQFDTLTFLDPYQFLVIFSGGTPSSSYSNWITASTGSLGLNNSGDTVTLRDAENILIDQITYGSNANENQSITRYPAGSDYWQQHTLIDASIPLLYSPGFDPFNNTNDDNGNQKPMTVPEPATGILTFLGTSLLIFRDKILRD